MTTHKHLKRRVRERMSQTGERYAAARRIVIESDGAADRESATGSRAEGGGPLSSAGIHPESASLRAALARVGATAPHTGQPWSEAMLFGLGGGVGIGVFAFHYEAEHFSSFHLAGRHLWDDSPAFLRAAAARAGAHVDVLETGSAHMAAVQLREALAAGRGVIASVDIQPLGYRGVPPQLAGGGYHVVFVRAQDEAAETIELEDLHPSPITIDARTFAAARARIRSQKHRLVVVAMPDGGRLPSLQAAIREALVATADGLEGILERSAGGRRGRNFNLDALGAWARRLHGNRSGQGWWRMFPPGPRLWRGLVSIADCASHAGTGGGLLRPLYASFLREAADVAGKERSERLRILADHYDALGRGWSELATAALPSSVPALGEAATLLARRERLFLERGARATDDLVAIWARLAAVEADMGEGFPLSGAEVDDLLADLAARVRRLETAERSAAAGLRAAAG